MYVRHRAGYIGPMQVRPMSVPGAWEFTPTLLHDDRGTFLEAFTAADVEWAAGHPLHLAQINMSVSHRGVIRGIHGCLTPPGQAKYVMCVVGRIVDIVVDLLPGSPTFGLWDEVILDDSDRRAVFVSEGLGHGFQVLSPSATVVYVTSTSYDPETEFAINPLDPELGIGWHDVGDVILSEKDSQALSLAEFRTLAKE